MRNLNAVNIVMLQTRVYKGLENKEKNIERALNMIDRAITGKFGIVDIVALPETFATGLPPIFPLDMDVLCSWGERLPETPGELPRESPTLMALSEKAREHKIFIQAGSILEVDSQNHFHNTAVLLGDDGKFLGKYSKIQPWVPEPGGREVFTVIDTEIGKIGMMICYDGSFPEIARVLALRGAEIIFRPTEMNDPLSTEGMNWWRIENRSRAIENHCYIIGTSCIEEDEIFTYPGASMAVDPYGRILLAASESMSERALFVTVNVNEVRRIRKEWITDNHLRDLKVGLYAKEFAKLAKPPLA